MSLGESVKRMIGLGFAAAHGIKRTSAGEVQDGTYTMMVLGKRIPFIKKGNRIIVKLKTDFTYGECDCGNPDCGGKPKKFTFDGVGIAKLFPGERMFIKFGVKLAMLRCIQDVTRQKKEFFETRMISQETILQNALVGELNVMMPELKLERLEGVKLKKVYRDTQPTKAALEAAAEAAAMKEASETQLPASEQ